MTSHKVTSSDIEKTMLKLSQEETMLKQNPLVGDVITLDDSSDEDNAIVNGNVAAADSHNNTENENTSETSSEDASLLATLRLLASLDSGIK